MFCSNCGNKLCDEAYVCPNCGCLANGNEPKVKVSAENANGAESKKELLAKIFMWVAFGLIGLSFIFVMLSIADMYIDVYNSYYVDTYLADIAIPAFIIAILALGAGITAFVLGLKSTDRALKMMTTLCFIVSVTMQLLSLLFVIRC